MTAASPAELCLTCNHPLDPVSAFCGECGTARVPTPPEPVKKRSPRARSPRQRTAPTDIETAPEPTTASDDTSTVDEQVPTDVLPSDVDEEHRAGELDAEHPTVHEEPPAQVSESHEDGDWFAELGGTTDDDTPIETVDITTDMVEDQSTSAAQAATPADEAEGETSLKRRRPTRRQVLLGTGIMLVLAVAAGATTLGSSFTPAPGATGSEASTVKGAETVTLPGWATASRWTFNGVTSASLSADGEWIAVLHTSGQVSVLDAATGTPVTALATTEPATAVHALNDGAVGFVAVSATGLAVWRPGTPTATTTATIAAGAKVAVRNGRALVFDGTNVASLTQQNALAPYVAPFSGASAIAAAAGDTMLWASAKKQVLTASSLGAVSSTTSLIAPDGNDQSTIARWLGTIRDHLYLVWTLADSSTVLATYALTAGDAASVSSQPVSADAALRLLVTDDTSAGIYGNVLADTASGALTVPAPEFTAARAVGASFLGSNGTANAILSTAGAITEFPPPTVIPIGIDGEGTLLALSGTTLAAYPAS